RRETELPADLCGNCQLCLEACPTSAFVQPYVMDARRCISYLTIELRGSIPEDLRAPMGRHVFGCDICQDVCPWNRRAPWSPDNAFQPHLLHEESLPNQSERESEQTLYHPRLEQLASLSEAEFSHNFRRSSIRRSRWAGILRNTCVALGNSAALLGPAARRRVSALLRRLAGSNDAGVSESARWAIRRIGSTETRFAEPGNRKTAV